MRNKPWGVARAALAGTALACLITSCDPAGQVGLEVLDSDVPLGASYVEYPTEASTIRRTDSVRTANKDNFLVGTLLDGNVGLTTAQAFLQVEPTSVNPSSPLAAGTVDSLILTLSYAQFYGTADRRLQIAAYELAQPFADDKAYYGDSELPVSGTELGVAHFIPLYTTTITKRRILVRPWVAGDTITRVDTVKANTLKPVRIPLRNGDLKDRLYRAIGTSDMASFANFQKNVLKGIALKAYNNTGGTIVNFDPLKVNTRMVLYYHVTSDTTRRSFTFDLGNTQTQRHFTRIRTDFARGSKLTTLNPPNPDEIPAAPSNDLTTYLQAGVELGTKLRIPGLEELKARQGKIVINRAELYIPVKEYSSGVYPIPSRAFLYQLGTTHRPLKTSGDLRTVQANGAAQTGNNNPAVVSYDASQQAYRVLLTSFLDAYINDKLPDQSLKALLLTPTVTGVSALSLNRAIIDAGPNRIKLKVYYSTLQ